MSVTNARASCGRLQELRVLVVEDSWLIADTLAVVLEAEGATVLGPTPTAAGALELLKQEVVHVALVDMSLGDGFADALIGVLDERQVPFFIVTGFGALPTNADAGAIKVIEKPVGSGPLIDLLDKFIKSRH